MKKFQLLTAATLFSGIAFAQTVEFVEPRNVLTAIQPEISTYKVKDNTYVLYHYFDSGVFKSYYQLDAYDANLKTIGSNDIVKSATEGENDVFEGLFALPDKLVLFKSGWEKKTGNGISYYPISADGKKGEGKELARFPAEKMMNTGGFNVNVSPDGSKIVVQCEMPFVKDSLEHTMIYVFDNNFKQLWSCDYRFPNADGTEKYLYNDIYVNNAGVVYDMKRVPVKKALDHFTVFTFLNNGKKVEERKMDLGENGHISTYRSGFCSNGDLVMCGYYYPDKKAGINVETPVGVFYIKVSAVDGGMPVDKLTPVTPDAAIKSNKLIVLADNSAILVAEDEYITKTLKPNAQPNTPGGTDDYDYNNTNISVIKFGPDGSKKWDHMIERDVKSRNDGGRTLGISALMVGDNLIITYQDFMYRHDGKPHVGIIDPIYGSWRADIMEKISPDGIKLGETMLTDKRLAGRDAEYALLPATGVKESDTVLFFISVRGLELVSTKITL
jgi:hypothetical protein